MLPRGPRAGDIDALLRLALADAARRSAPLSGARYSSARWMLDEVALAQTHYPSTALYRADAHNPPLPLGGDACTPEEKNSTRGSASRVAVLIRNAACARSRHPVARATADSDRRLRREQAPRRSLGGAPPGARTPIRTRATAARARRADHIFPATCAPLPTKLRLDLLETSARTPLLAPAPCKTSRSRASRRSTWQRRRPLRADPVRRRLVAAREPSAPGDAGQPEQQSRGGSGLAEARSGARTAPRADLRPGRGGRLFLRGRPAGGHLPPKRGVSPRGRAALHISHQ